MNNRFKKSKYPSAKRLMLEGQELRDKTKDYCAKPIDDNLFEWPPNAALEGDQSSQDESDFDEDDTGRLAVASAEEYAAKIVKLQQACLIPLKEDLADWLNKILKTSQITTYNFMDKLDNGVIICRLAKIISTWCKQQLEQQEQENNAPSRGLERTSALESSYGLTSPSPQPRSRDNGNQSAFIIGPLRASSSSQSTNCFIKTSASATSLNNGLHLCYHSNQFMNNLIRMHHIKIWENAKCRTFYARDNVCNFIKWSRDFGVNRSVLFESDDLVLHANARQVVLCLLDVARIAYVRYNFTEAPGLVKFEQEIDKELLAYKHCGIVGQANDFSVGNLQQNLNSNSDNLHDISTPVVQSAANRRNLLAANRTRGSISDATDELVMRYCRHKEEEAARRKRQEELDALAKYERQQEPQQAPQREYLETVAESADSSLLIENESLTNHLPDRDTIEPDSLMSLNAKGSESAKVEMVDTDDLDGVVTSSSDMKFLYSSGKNFITDHGRVDSLDSGEGPTESASTAHSGGRTRDEACTTTIASNIDGDHLQVPAPRHSKASDNTNTNTSPTPASHTTTTATTNSNSVSENSELSSSRSSLLSNQDGNTSTSNYGRQITSDLDGKVMRIAKSYYGKKATRDVTRLSEGKYKIADRIVFVRLLKGHRVMVRIGGGWDTLENFLFRHKSDPTQVIDPDNLLPLETKMSLEKSTQVTPKSGQLRTPTGFSRLPNYRRSNSTSSTNLSLSNLSFSNLSLASSHNTTATTNNTPLKQKVSTPVRLNKTMVGSSYNSTPSVDQSSRRQIPCLLIHKGKPVNRSPRYYPATSFAASHSSMTSVSDGSKQPNGGQQQQRKQQQQEQQPTTQRRATNAQATLNSPGKSLLKKPQNHFGDKILQQRASSVNSTPIHGKAAVHVQRPLALSRAPTLSASNLYPATLTTSTPKSRI